MSPPFRASPRSCRICPPARCPAADPVKPQSAHDPWQGICGRAGGACDRPADPGHGCRRARRSGVSAAETDRGPVRAEHGTCPPLAHLVASHMVSDGFAPGAFATVARTNGATTARRHRFRNRRSFNAAWPRRASASRRSSLAFSSSSAFNRFASDTSMPPKPGLAGAERGAADPLTKGRDRRSSPLPRPPTGCR